MDPVQSVDDLGIEDPTVDGIEMPPAFHFPEDQAPPSDLVGQDFSRDVTDNVAMYPMMSQMYKEFDHLTMEEKHQLFAKAMQEEEEYPVPEIEGAEIINKPPGVLLAVGAGPSRGRRNIRFDPLALLLDASLEGELDLVQTTASQVANPSAANDEGITALHNAICAGHFDIVKFLVEFGCDVNSQDSDGWTPLHCAASCNNLPMVRFLVEHGACIFATTFSDHETAAEKCEEDEEGFDGCSEYLYNIQEKLGTMNGGKVFAVYDYQKSNDDELDFKSGDSLAVVRRGDEKEIDWWWAKTESGSAAGQEGYIAKNLLGLYARVKPVPVSDSIMSEGSDSNDDSTAANESNRDATRPAGESGAASN